MYGETCIAWASLPSCLRLSPHVRGTPGCARPIVVPRRLSPHVRGNLARVAHSPHLSASIPACTGKPRQHGLGAEVAGVYPRMYGETLYLKRAGHLEPRLSPHVRGNRGRAAVPCGILPSIPACTGKPSSSWTARPTAWVYPRMYGETKPHRRYSAFVEGLSPHVRGNRSDAPAGSPGMRSIPACTGKPEAERRHQAMLEVYPRMYGETGTRSPRTSSLCGLSPHVRGNRTGGARVVEQGRVYPRMYGETPERDLRMVRVQGLSPHVRGNHALVVTCSV